jgi:hypothetical protein
MKRLWLLPCLTILFTAMLAAADVAGKWTGNVEVDDPSEGSTMNVAVRAEFQLKDGAVTGSVGRHEEAESEPIQDAKLDGNKLTFTVTAHEENATFKFVLTLDGDKLEGNMSGNLDGQQMNGKVHLARAAE